MDSHKTKACKLERDDDGDKMTGAAWLLKVATSMYNLYYQLPVPVVNLILGVTGILESLGNSGYDHLRVDSL